MQPRKLYCCIWRNSIKRSLRFLFFCAALVSMGNRFEFFLFIWRFLLLCAKIYTEKEFGISVFFLFLFLFYIPSFMSVKHITCHLSSFRPIIVHFENQGWKFGASKFALIPGSFYTICSKAVVRVLVIICRAFNLHAAGLFSCFILLIVLGFNDTSTLVGHFVSSPREREKSDRRDSRRD